jgi:hypothetical protein
MKWLLLLTALFAVTASAADVSGTWKGTADTPNGTVERTFVFKVDGAKLTGETSSQMLGKSTIMDGKVEGDKVTFTITAKFEDQEIKLNYTGKVSGDEIKFHVESADGQLTLDYSAKRVS